MFVKKVIVRVAWSLLPYDQKFSIDLNGRNILDFLPTFDKLFYDEPGSQTRR